MNELVSQLIFKLSSLNITLPIFSKASLLAISLIGVTLSIKVYLINKNKSHKDERRTFINDCKPLIDNGTITAHEEILLMNSYYSLKGHRLDIVKLKKITNLSKTYATLNHFILAGHLIEIENNKIIKKPANAFMRIYRKIKAISLSSTVLGFYLLTGYVIPNFLKQFITDETKIGITLLYIILISIERLLTIFGVLTSKT